MSDKRLYTLEEARQELERRKCAHDGHRFEVLIAFETQEPYLIICKQCGRGWRAVAAAKTKR